MEVHRFAKLFDHSIVRPDASLAEVQRSARQRRGWAPPVTVQPHYVGFAARALRDSGVLIGTVVGFPHGNETPSMKPIRRGRSSGWGRRNRHGDEHPRPEERREERSSEMWPGWSAPPRPAGEGYSRELLPQPEEKQRPASGSSREEPLREDIHRLCRRRCHAGGRPPHVPGRERSVPREGCGRNPEIRDVLAYLEAGARRFGSTRTEQLVGAFQTCRPRNARHSRRICPSDLEAVPKQPLCPPHLLAAPNCLSVLTSITRLTAEIARQTPLSRNPLCL